ncbi:MAG: Peptidoglycan-binding lysin domain protein [Myxococcales bacterium]|nr:Peptidoglycan-binding lysin domain protein [Myxococcales bacterium]
MTRAALVLAILLAAAGPATAQVPASDTLTIRAKPNDSLALLAAEYYGDRNRAIFIMVANKIVHPRPLKAGERIKIPVSRQVITSPGDTFETLAAAYLGNALRGTFLAEFNNLSPDDTLASGTSLSIPFTVTHTASATESIASIAAAYFGDTKNATMLRQYNFLEKDAIEKGEQLIVPIFNVRLSASKMPSIDADSKARRERQKEVQARAATALPAAKQAWRIGDFGEVKGALAEVELYLDYLDTAQAVDVGVLLGSLHVAFNDTKPALEAFKRVLERKSTHQLSAYQVSPKVLAVWKEAGGTVAP